MTVKNKNKTSKGIQIENKKTIINYIEKYAAARAHMQCIVQALNN